jgi:anti-sigma regulatory factor (Ser/Thr protein kinase)
VTWNIVPDFEEHAHALTPLSAEVLFYATREAIRNAARYARGDNAKSENIERLLRLNIGALCEKELQIIIEDNGVGFIEHSNEKKNDDTNLSDKSRGGSGRGLELHSTMMAIVGGTLSPENRVEGGTRITLSVPLAQNADAKKDEKDFSIQLDTR